MASASLGSLVIELAANTARLTSDLGRAATIAEKQARRMTRMFRGAAGLVGGFSLVLLGKKFFDNMDEAQRASGQLAAALKSTGGAAGLTVGQLDNLAKSLQKTTTFSDEAVKGVESILLAFTNLHGEQFKAATAAVTDLSTRLGIDLTSAAKLVGKALNDPAQALGALRKAGVSFTDSEKQVILHLAKTGQIAQAQDKILAALTVRFGGAAEAARNTLGGAISGLKNAFGDLFEGTVEQTNNLTKGINSIAKALEDPAIKRGIDDGIGFAIERFKELGFWLNRSAQGWKLIAEILGKPFKTESSLEKLQTQQSEIGAEIQRTLDKLDRLKGNHFAVITDREFKLQMQHLEELQAQMKGVSERANNLSTMSGPTTGHPTGLPLLLAAAKARANAEKAVAEFESLSEIQPFGDRASDKRFRETMLELNQQFQAGKLSLEEYGQAVADARDKMDPLGNALDAIKESTRATNAAFDEGKAIFSSTRTVAERYAITLAHLNDLLKAGAFGEGADGIDTYNRAVKEAQDQASGWNDKISEGKAIIEATRTDAERYAATIQHLNDLLESGAFGKGAEAVDTYTRAVMQAQDQLDSFTKTVKEGLHNAFEDMLNTGKFNTRSLVQFMIAELSKKALFNAIDKIIDAIAKIFKKPSGSGGFFGTLLGALGGVFGGGGGGGNKDPFAGTGFAKGGSFTVGGESGTDANLVQFKATKGEQVTVSKPGQSNGASITLVSNPTYNIAPGVTRQELLPLLRQTHQQSISDMSELIRRGRFA